MFMGINLGKYMISGGSSGVSFQSHSPKSASQYLVKTLMCFYHSCFKSHPRARTIYGSSGEEPVMRSAK